MSTKIADVTLNKKGTKLTLNTNGKYVNDDKFFNLNVRDGAGTVTIASTDATIQSDASGRNISGVIGSKTISAPVSGYYVKIDASGSGLCTVTTSGWLAEGSLGTASATETYYFPVQQATAAISGTNIVTPTASIAGTNVTLSNTNNGVSMIATGGGTAAASISVTSTQAGYVPNNSTLDTQTVAASSQSTTASTYISGVILPKPASGTNKFSITVPNGNTTITFVFNVDFNGDVTVTEE